MATRWGIVSSGKISSDFCNALCIDAFRENHELVAVAARDAERAKKFAETFGIKKSYGSYEDLSSDPEVEVVYVGSINTTHIDICKMMINKGKHVLCEKPLGMDVQETKELIELAQSKKVFLMEAMWSRFQPTHQRIQSELSKGSIGDVLYSVCHFCVPIAHLDRIAKKEMGGGAMLDIGIYTVNFSQMVHGDKYPVSIKSSGTLNSDGVDEQASVIMTYPDGATAVFTVSTKITMSCNAEVYGTKGSMKIPDKFWCGTQLVLPSGETMEHKHDTSGIRVPFIFDNSAGLALEAEHVRECINKGLNESPVVTHDITLNAAKIMQEVRKMVGVKY